MSKLVWIDVETTGLDPGKDRLLEIAVVVTDSDLKECGVYHTPIADALQLSDWDTAVVKMHAKSGLIGDVRDRGIAIWEAQDAIRIRLNNWGVGYGEDPLAGSTVYFDRAFLKAYMPEIAKRLHYRNIDVSTVKQLVSAWAPGHEWAKADIHRALPDIRDSIAELEHYRALLFEEIPA